MMRATHSSMNGSLRLQHQHAAQHPGVRDPADSLVVQVSDRSVAQCGHDRGELGERGDSFACSDR